MATLHPSIAHLKQLHELPVTIQAVALTSTVADIARTFRERVSTRRALGTTLTIHQRLSGRQTQLTRLANEFQLLRRLERDPAYLRNFVEANLSLFHTDGQPFYFMQDYARRQAEAAKELSLTR